MRGIKKRKANSKFQTFHRKSSSFFVRMLLAGVSTADFTFIPSVVFPLDGCNHKNVIKVAKLVAIFSAGDRHLYPVEASECPRIRWCGSKRKLFDMYCCSDFSKNEKRLFAV